MLEKLIKYFVYATKGYITKDQLIKFLYLADLYAVKWTGKQLTDLDWYFYKSLPWNDEIETVLNQMNGKEIIQVIQENTIFIKPGVQASDINDLHLPLSLKLILDNICREWAGTEPEKLTYLLRYVYNTVPIQEVKNTYKPEKKVKLNLQAEREKLISELGL
ncbi:MAG TPA: type II toxin-antitoxin system antitoxin SocA domain-containing protein [Nostocaceae cyanobacterium]|nr:type II toxin-antitoxin system antitoxin SocA domain-containing protein [Nostocaceae cyanobacterium]